MTGRARRGLPPLGGGVRRVGRFRRTHLDASDAQNNLRYNGGPRPGQTGPDRDTDFDNSPSSQRSRRGRGRHAAQPSLR